MTEKTRYRKLCTDGHWDLLQYEKEVRGWFSKKKKWFYVPRPYYDTFYGRETTIYDDTWVCSINTNLGRFVEQWPDINDYLKYFEKEQARLKQKALDYRADIEKKKGTVKILT